jgi:hypothetical protein
LRNWYGDKKNEKLDKKDFLRRLIQEVLDKKEKTGVTFWTFGVEHYELKENTVQYKKNAKVPNFIINKTCHMGHFSWDMRRGTEI